jgi:molybdopterin-guanine dinucleotide biosynthesis protein
MHVYGIVGRKNSGKTHLVTRLVRAAVAHTGA